MKSNDVLNAFYDLYTIYAISVNMPLRSEGFMKKMSRKARVKQKRFGAGSEFSKKCKSPKDNSPRAFSARISGNRMKSIAKAGMDGVRKGNMNEYDEAKGSRPRREQIHP